MTEGKRRKKALTDIRLEFFNEEMSRVTIKILAPEVETYLRDNEVYIETETGHKTRIGWASHIKNRYNETILPISRVPAFARQLRRIADQLEGNRSIDSLATEAQLNRVKQFYTILAKRKDNVLYEPAEIDMYTHGEIGRLRSDLEAILVKEKLWDPENKIEIKKPKKVKTEA